MILVIDNYDSFTFNLVHFLGDVGAQLRGLAQRRRPVDSALARAPEAIVLSPGPCTPNDAGICLKLIEAAAGKMPILGVCLGHQAIGQAFGGQVVRAPAPMHGKVSRIFHAGTDILGGVPSPFSATRYHSLIIDRASLPDVLVPHRLDGGRRWSWALRHRVLPVIRRAVPPRKHRQRARPRNPCQFSRHRPRRQRARARRRRLRRYVEHPQARAGPPRRRRDADRDRIRASVRHHHVRRSDAGADRRPADGDAGARRTRGRD